MLRYFLCVRQNNSQGYKPDKETNTKLGVVDTRFFPIFFGHGGWRPRRNDLQYTEAKAIELCSKEKKESERGQGREAAPQKIDEMKRNQILYSHRYVRTF